MTTADTDETLAAIMRKILRHTNTGALTGNAWTEDHRHAAAHGANCYPTTLLINKLEIELEDHEFELIESIAPRR